MTEPNQKPLKLNVGLPAVAADGNGISIDDNGNVGLIFFQLVNQAESEMTANAVANIRLNMQQLTQLQDTIEKSISTHREKKQKGDGEESEPQEV
jgi:hypothetical protein